MPGRPRERELVLYFHPGQFEAWDAAERFVAVFAGTQSGKTSWGPFWLWREIYGDDTRRGCGPGDYLAVTATYKLFQKKMLPAMREVFERLFRVGRYWPSAQMIELRPNDKAPFWARRVDDPMWGRIILGSAESRGGLESATAKAAWLDEAGQTSYTGESWRAVQSRLALNRGRALLTTTLYNFGYIKTDIYDRWKAGDGDYRVVHFDSIVNPAFPRDEWDRARRTLPPWMFSLRYRGRFDKPAGLIYDSFRDESFPGGHRVEPAAYPANWFRYVGLDFGGAHTAAVFFAEEPGSGVVRAYRQYLAGRRTAAEHVRELLRGEPPLYACVGGSPSEGQWRDEFRAAGLPVFPPDVSSVEIGIGRVYGAFADGRVLVHDDLDDRTAPGDATGGLLGELRSYSRKLRDGQPAAEIENKSLYHRLDAARYVLGWRFRDAAPASLGTAVAATDRRWGA